MKQIKQLLDIGPIGKLIVTMQTILLLFIHFSGTYFFQLNSLDTYRIIHSYLSLWLLFASLTWAIHHYKKCYQISISILTTCWCILIGYIIHTNVTLEYSILTNNRSEAFNLESIQVITNAISPYPFIIAIIGAMIILYKNKNKPRKNYQRPPLYSGCALLIYTLLTLTPIIQS